MSDQYTIRWPRRRFLTLVGSTPVLVLGYSLGARASDKPRLDPESERAQKLQYTHDAKTAEHPDREPNARCANCTHFHGDKGDTWSSCNIFPNHEVKANGWCTSWFSAS